MKIEKVKLSDIKQAESNVRNHPEKQVDEMKRSVEKFGQIRPLVVDGETNETLAGNGLLLALRELEWEQADAIVVRDLSGADKKKLMIADNRIYALGTDNHDNIFDILESLGDNLDVPGYDDSLLENLLSDDDELDEELSSYGRIEPEDINTIKDNGERTEERMVSNPYQEKEEDTLPVEERYDTSKMSEASQGGNQAESKSVPCPNCGGTGWL